MSWVGSVALQRVQWTGGGAKGLKANHIHERRSVVQMMFYDSSWSDHPGFNQPLNAWDVREVTDMSVRCSPRRAAAHAA